MTNSSAPVWIVCIFGALIPLTLFIGATLAAWRRLIRDYPDSPFPAEATFRSIAGHIGGTYLDVYNPLRIEVGQPGIRISPWSPLSRFLPPFMVPWSRITSCEKVRTFFLINGIRIVVKGWPAPIFLKSRLWREERFEGLVETAWQERHATAESPKCATNPQS